MSIGSRGPLWFGRALGVTLLVVLASSCGRGGLEPVASTGAIAQAITNGSQIVVTNQYDNTCQVYHSSFAATANGQSYSVSPVWSLSLGDTAVDCRYKRNSNQSQWAGLGYLVVTTGGDRATIWDQSSKNNLFTKTGLSALQPHSVELLPDGNIAVAGPGNYTCDTSVQPAGCPAGATIFTCGGVRIINTTDASKYYDFPLCGAHGLAFDWSRKVLWATSRGRLDGYNYNYTSWPSTQPTVYRDATIPSTMLGFDSYLHDGRVIPNGHVLAVSPAGGAEYDVDNSIWLANASANCHFSTTYWKCTPSGVPDYGSGQASHGNDLNSADVDPVTGMAVISQKDGVGEAWDSNKISFFPTNSYYYNMSNSTATNWYYRVHFWEAEYP